MSKNKHSRVGQRMKPRGEQPAMQNQEKPLSTNPVQAEGGIEPVSEPEKGIETPPSLEAETAEKGEDKPNLVKMLLESAKEERAADEERLARDIHTSGKADALQHSGEPDLSPEAVQAAIDKDAKERHEHVADPVPAPIKPPDEELGVEYRGCTPETAPIPDSAYVSSGIRTYRLGTLPNGDYAEVITIPEELVEGVRQFAEADGNKPMRQWCSEFFVMMLEAYCTPNRAR
jgi:hypothetical protein